jgi:RNA polymerase sigma-70 factor (ECF subfamily)
MTADPSYPAPSGTDDLLPTRQSLLARLRNWDDDLGWQEFFDLYWRLIYSVGLRAGLTESEAQDLVQETVISVAKAMKEFHYDPTRGSFKGWLLQLTGWRITNQLHKRNRGMSELASSESTMSGSPLGPDPLQQAVLPELERLWDAEWEDNLYRTALARVQRKVNPKHFQIFDLCVTQHKPVKAVRQFLGVSAMEVYLSRHRVGRLIQQEVKRLREQLL